MDDLLTRRNFLGGAATLAAASLAAPSVLRADAGRSMKRLGGPIFLKSDDPGELAREHRRLGYRAAYAPTVDLNDHDKINAIVREFAAQDVVIAEVGAWVNMLDPDPEKRRKNLDYVQQRLALAEELGARCCVDIAGSYDPKLWFGPNPKNVSREFIDATVENCRHLLDAVKPKRTKFSIEMMPYSFPTGPDEYLELIKSVDRPGFAVHLDFCNVINSPTRMYNNGAVIRECFEKLGRWTVSCHSKDLAWDAYYQVYLKEVIPGRGLMDYRVFLTELAKLPGDVPFMLEHLNTALEYDEARGFVRKTASEVGLNLEPVG